MDLTDTSFALNYIFDRVDLGILVVNRDKEILLWNQFMVKNSGKKSESVMGTNLFECFPDLPKDWLSKKIDGVFVLKNFAFTSWEQRPFLFRFTHHRPITGGHVEYMYQNCTFMPFKNQEGEVESVCIILQDVTDEGISKTLLKLTLAQLERSSRIDGLTQLFNRVHWEARLSEEFHRVKRYGGICTLIMFDLDHFKSVNDNHGHLAGDHVLREVAKRTRANLRDTDVAGRYGGEEFGIILPGTERAGAEQVAERLCQSISSPAVELDELEIQVTVSLGLVEMDPQLQEHEDALGQADTALYQSKENGRNCWTYYQPKD
jgi:diguanylate cyclase (GGDEF)-like protein|tara:strand:- start:4055 stop:5011 length:957 start_codon:yes stop_codon:yes gene_type:complete